MLITEIFASIQGEGQRAGLPTAFVRLARCPYRCSWCDSEHTFTGGTPMSVDQVLEAVSALGPLPNICITGGEPLVQRVAVLELVSRLLGDDAALRTVEIETSGGLPIWPAEDERLHWDLDVKCPGSGMERHFVPDNLCHLRAGDEIKFVVVDRRDFEFARDFVTERLPGTVAGIFLQPAWGQLDPATLAGWLRDDPIPGARLSLQLHKYIWGPDILGV
jgi:7-carboxy-7-deazaguanine synthase